MASAKGKYTTLMADAPLDYFLAAGLFEQALDCHESRIKRFFLEKALSMQTPVEFSMIRTGNLVARAEYLCRLGEEVEKTKGGIKQ